MHTRKKPPQTRHRNGYNQTRDGVPYYRRPIPDDLKERFGEKAARAKKPEFLRCLRSMTYEEAEAEYLRIAGLMPGEAPRDLQPVAQAWPPDFDEGYLKHLARRGGNAFREHVARLDSWAGETRARVALGIVQEPAHVAALETQAAKYERLTRQARGEKVAPTVTLRVAVERFLKTVTAPSTLRQYKPRLEDVMAALGADRDIIAITKADCRQFAQETIHRVPQHWRKRWPALALADAIKKAEADNLPTIAHETKYGIVVLMRRFFAWCEEEGLVQVSPARGAPSPKGRRGRRSDFSTHHLKHVFGSEPYTPDKREADPALFWSFLLGLFGGMRRAEIAFMRKEDLRHERGVWFFDLREDPAAGRKLKTASSIRSVPVHPPRNRRDAG